MFSRIGLHRLAILTSLILFPSVLVWAAGEKVLHTFTNTPDGNTPSSGLVRDSAGNLYGTSLYGGSQSNACPRTVGCGVVYKISRPGGQFTETVIYQFKGELLDGQFPAGSVVFDSSGNLYGTTSSGGDAGCGIVYELTPTTSGQWKETILHNFNTFTGNNDGCSPYSYLVFDSQGNLYGTTKEGGGGATNTFCDRGCGTVFKLSPQANGKWAETVIHSFPGTAGNFDGQNPYSGLVFDNAGNLWGTTQAGGTGGVVCNPFGSPPGCGTVFELSPNSDGTWSETTLFSFQDASTGWYPYYGLTADSSGNLYGHVVNGGPGNGAIYKITPQNGTITESLIYTFAPCDEVQGCLDGVFPWSGLAFDSAGNLYGSTLLGGGANFNCNVGGSRPTGCGTTFKLTPQSDGTWSETILYRFLGTSDGQEPQGDNVLVTASGQVIGTTLTGGSKQACPSNSSSGGCGVVWKVTP